ncbi:MAG: HsdR family type I site-specific deoxyribonuclease [Deltaproteobacteria bacterium]|nr:HsdR family type I site-specific deoxyribonuclease [Deltaproteobacteria bacterium]
MNERAAVQNPMLRYAQEVGWEYLKPEKALEFRGGETGIYFSGILEAQLFRLNPGVVDEGRAADIIRRLSLLKPAIEGNRDALAWLRGEMSVFVPEENRERNVRLVDLEKPENNLFQVTDEWPQKSVVFRNRADVVFLINGIPVALAETKAAGKPDALAQGVEQIRRYHRETPEMFTATQVFEVTQLLDFFYGATWSTSRKNLFNWREEVPGDYEAKIKTFFDPARFLQVIKDYIIFLTKDDELTKVILRQHQTRGVEKVIGRVLEPVKRRGLIWHTQGSGKTLTMITIAARLLRETVGAEKPTVLMLVDRNELEAQLFKNITSYGFTQVKVAESKRALRKILREDYRGLVVSMVHKFDDVPADLNTRKNIIVLVDEAHRTTGGDLGNYLMAALPNATYIGFTGTPIDKLSQGKGTFKVFGVDDETGYLDKYSIAESIEDGTTVKLNYALAPSELRVDRETLEKEFLSLTVAEGVSDPEELNAILDRAVALKEIMKSPTRMERVAQYMADHFRENVEPMGFKAFLVAVDREACAMYKRVLNNYLPKEYSRVVYSPAHTNGATLKEFYLSDDEEKKIRREFIKKEALPKILIVTEKLLTGYDAPILYCMYLDKPMRDHVLLQAIARVNRPYEDDDGLVKPCGFVLDFVGIFENLEKALAFDSDVVASVIQNVDVLKRLFASLMEERGPDYLPLAQGRDDKAKERAIAHFADKTRREELFKFFRQLQNLYDILSPDAFLRPFMDDYQKLAELYGLIRNAYTDQIYVDKELTAKTRELLRQHATGGEFELPGAIHELGPKELAALKDGDTSDSTKVLNLKKILAETVIEESGAKPFLISIGERAEALAQAYEDRQLTTQQALLEFEKLAQEYVKADAQREKMGVDENTFAIYISLKNDHQGIKKEQAQAINTVFEGFPDYRWDEAQMRRLRTELYKVLYPLVGAEKVIKAANALLRLQRV